MAGATEVERSILVHIDDDGRPASQARDLGRCIQPKVRGAMQCAEVAPAAGSIDYSDAPDRRPPDEVHAPPGRPHLTHDGQATAVRPATAPATRRCINPPNVAVFYTRRMSSAIELQHGSVGDGRTPRAAGRPVGQQSPSPSPASTTYVTTTTRV